MTRGSYYLFRLPRDGGLLLAARPGQEPFAWEFQLKDPELERIWPCPHQSPACASGRSAS